MQAHVTPMHISAILGSNQPESCREDWERLRRDEDGNHDPCLVFGLMILDPVVETEQGS